MLWSVRNAFSVELFRFWCLLLVFFRMKEMSKTKKRWRRRSEQRVILVWLLALYGLDYTYMRLWYWLMLFTILKILYSYNFSLKYCLQVAWCAVSRQKLASCWSVNWEVAGSNLYRGRTTFGISIPLGPVAELGKKMSALLYCDGRGWCPASARFFWHFRFLLFRKMSFSQPI